MVFQCFSCVFVLFADQLVDVLELVVQLFVYFFVLVVDGFLQQRPRLLHVLYVLFLARDALLNFRFVVGVDFFQTLSDRKHFVFVFGFVLFEALTALEHIFIIFFMAIVAKILDVLTGMDPAFHVYAGLARADDALDGVLLRVPEGLGDALVGKVLVFLHVQLGFSVDVFGGDVDVFVLLGDADDEVPDVVGEGFLAAGGADNLIFCLKLAGL